MPRFLVKQVSSVILRGDEIETIKRLIEPIPVVSPTGSLSVIRPSSYSLETHSDSVEVHLEEGEARVVTPRETTKRKCGFALLE